MSQQLIDFGAFPNDPAADPIRAAFQKVQNNFTELYQTTSTTGVVSLTTTNGLTQNRINGNVVIAANISNITIQTGPGLLVGVGTATGNTATVLSHTTPFVIALGNTLTTGNIVASNIVGTVRSTSQPFITTVGTLNNLSVANAITASSFTGNSFGNFSGNYTSPGSNTQILFNRGGNIGAATNLTFTGSFLRLTGEFLATGNITGLNMDGGNLIKANYFQGTFLGPAAAASAGAGTGKGEARRCKE
jgi:hypothetical protein